MAGPTLWFGAETAGWHKKGQMWRVWTQPFVGTPIKDASYVSWYFRGMVDQLPKGYWPKGGPEVLWGTPATYETDEWTEIDAPHDPASFYIISDRLKEFFEKEVPGQLEFLPVRMRGPGWQKLKYNYWATIFKNKFDCIDETESLWSSPDEETGERTIMWEVIDPARIPDGQRIGILRSSPIWHRTLKLAYDKAGFIGFSFMKLPVIKAAQEKPKRTGRRLHDEK